MSHPTELLSCVDKLKQWIIQSEMEGHIDVTDSFYPAYRQLDIIREKLEEDDKTSGQDNL